MNLEEFSSAVLTELETIWIEHINHPELKSICQYALLPAGKLFRSQLVWAAASDSKPIPFPTHDLVTLACAIEIHHTYTLIHDDLPAMDNDDFRRGRPSLHKQFNDWKAILAGDALLILSFKVINQISNHSIRQKLLDMISDLTGPNGLILGQFLDLSQMALNSFDQVVEIHQLKTSNLFKLATSAATLICQDKKAEQLNSLEIGNSIGILFQLLDDLCELARDELPKHELMINPWFKYFSQTLNKSIELIEQLDRNLNNNSNYRKVLKPYLNKNIEILNQAQFNLLTESNEIKNWQSSLQPLMSGLNRFNLGENLT